MMGFVCRSSYPLIEGLKIINYGDTFREARKGAVVHMYSFLKSNNATSCLTIFTLRFYYYYY